MIERVCERCYVKIEERPPELDELLDSAGWSDVWPIEPGDMEDGDVSGYSDAPCAACGKRDGWLYAINAVIFEEE